MQYIPHDYQKYCIHKIINEQAIALFLRMGLGKTVVTMTAINDLRFNRFAICKCLVIAPKKVAEDTWIREQQKWDHLRMLRVVSVLGSAAKRIKAINSPGDIYVINRENVQWLVDYYRNDWPFDMVVIDESSSFKNARSKRFKKLNLVRTHISRIVELTGTPSSQGLTDLWAQIYLLDQGKRLGKTMGQYLNAYFTPASRNRTTIFSYEPLPGAEELIYDRIRDICVSMSTEDYVKLPDVVSNIRYIKLDDRAQKQYKEMERTHVLEFQDAVLDAGSAAALTGKLLQLANGAVYDGEHQFHEIHNNKIEAFMELVEANEGNHMLVFYSFKHDLVRIKNALAKTKLKVGELKTAEDITRWNCGEMDILLAHPASAAYGLNLQDGGNTVVWFGLTWSLELYEQANARLHRQGQKNTVFIHHLVVAGSVDEDVMAALESKGECQNKLLTALKARIDQYKEGD